MKKTYNNYSKNIMVPSKIKPFINNICVKHDITCGFITCCGEIIFNI